MEYFNEKEKQKEVKRKEIIKANNDVWIEQMEMNWERRYQESILEDTGGVQAHFLNQIFQQQEKLDIKKVDDSAVGK
jgi:5-methylthioribose kinase|tara:strand:+ start:2090 stop:2320 length:231 start_codon:yes stop_codon:yes gene_type:complete